MWRLALAVGAAASVAWLAPPAGPATPAPRTASAAPPRLGLLQEGRGSVLVRIEPDTLRVQAGRRLDVGVHGDAWSFSRDGSRLALGGDLDSLAIPTVLVVDTRGLRALGRVRLARNGWLRATAWLPDRRLVGVVSVFESGGVRTDVVTVDAGGRRILQRRSLSGQVLRVARTREGLVALLAPAEKLEPARLAVIDGAGAVRVLRIRRIPAGSERRTGGARGAEFVQREPALAVDPDRRKEFVIAASGEAAEVDLRTRAIAYHSASGPRSLFKSVAGPTRVARWLGNGRIAVTGGDYAVTDARFRFTPAGLELVDTGSWTVRHAGEGTDTVWPADGFLLAAATRWSSELELPRPPGLVVYDADGRERARLYDGKRVWLVHADARRAYVRVDGRVDVVELPSGRVVEQRANVPYPLVRPGARSES